MRYHAILSGDLPAAQPYEGLVTAAAVANGGIWLNNCGEQGARGSWYFNYFAANQSGVRHED